MLKVESKENRAALKAAISRYEQVAAIERGVDDLMDLDSKNPSGADHSTGSPSAQ